jgi:hypothetical protein
MTLFTKKATATKTGKHPKFPYVPVIKTSYATGWDRTSIVRGYAFATRAEAIAFAQKRIDQVWGPEAVET